MNTTYHVQLEPLCRRTILNSFIRQRIVAFDINRRVESHTMTQSPAPAILANELTKHISNYTANPGKLPLKLLCWALGELEDCARNRSVPSSEVMEVVNSVVVKDESQPRPVAPPSVDESHQPSASVGEGIPKDGDLASQPLEVASAGSRASGSNGGSGGSSNKGAVVFTPLYGCDETVGGVGPVCSILEVGGVTILLDCGWDIHFDTALLEPLREVVKRIDLVLISHPDLEHLGALPYAYGKLGMRAKIYATLPVWKMGQMAVYDAYISRTHEENFHAFDLDDVDGAFARFKTLKYSQHLTFSGRGAGITITPYAAGRMIGAAVWRVSWQTEDNDIVYATAYNHKTERHLRPSALSTLTRPSVLITDAHNTLTDVMSRKYREGRLIATVMDTVRGGGNVLMPTDTAGRVLELLVLLDEHWQKHRLGGYKLVLLHNTAFNTAEFAKSQLEWMSDEIGRAFDLQRSNPFELRNVHIMHSLEELDELGNDPKVVLASDMSLDYGFSKALLLRWASGSANTILLTGRGHGETTARALLKQVEDREKAAAMAAAKANVADRRAGVGGYDGEMEEGGGGEGEDEEPLTLRVKILDSGEQVPVRVPLAGEELRAFREEENRKRRLEAEEEEQRRHTAAMEKEQVIADSDDEGEGGEGDDGTANPPPKRRREIVASLFSKYSKPQHLMFGYYDPQIPTDEYGVKESQPIGWLAAAMQQQNSEMPVVIEEGGAVLQEARGKAQEDKKGEGGGGDGGDDGGDDEDEDSTSQGPVDALRAGAEGGKESAFFQDSGAVPTKLEQEEQLLEVLCRVVFVDSEGLSDGRSMRNTVRNLAPKMLIIMGGSRRSKADLVSHVRKQLDGDAHRDAKKAGGGGAGPQGGGRRADDDSIADVDRYVVVDKALEPLPVGLDSGAFDVLLHDSLHTQLKWKQLKNYEVAHMEGRVDPRGGTPLLCAKPRGEKAGHPAMFLSVGDVHIVQLQQALEQAGVSVKFLARTLRCEGGVTVRREGSRLELEGPLCPAYFRIREVVYQQYTIV